MLTQIGAKPESDFSDPLGMLRDCHKRIQFFLKDLVRLAETSWGKPLNGPERAALERALRYFKDSAPMHTADEEDSLFPRLRALKNQRLNELLERIDSLEAEHELADRAHRAVEEIAGSWLEGGPLNAADA